MPGASHEQGSLEGYSPKGCKELDVTEHEHELSIEFLYWVTLPSKLDRPRKGSVYYKVAEISTVNGTRTIQEAMLEIFCIWFSEKILLY